VLISADGYLSNSLDIILTDVESPPVEIALVKIDSPPAGSAIKQANINVTTSGASQATTLEVLNEQKATIVAINQGTIMKDSQGNAVTGNLTTTVATFSGTSEKAAQSFPGGNNIILAKDMNGKTNVPATLVPIAFADITIKSSDGVEVTNFTKPINISFEISPNTINPTTKNKVKEGDSFSIYSYSNATGVWTYDKEANVLSKNGKLFMSFESNHLTWFQCGNVFYETHPIQINLTMPGAPNNVLKIGTLLNFYAQKFITIGNERYGDFEGGRFSVTNLAPLTFTATIDQKGVVDYLTLTFRNPFTGQIVNKGVVDIQNSSSLNLSVPYVEGPIIYKAKTVNIIVNCEKRYCSDALQILPYNVGIEYNDDPNYYRTGNLVPGGWKFAGNVNYDKIDNKIKLKTYLPDNVNISLRAIAYPDYAQTIHTTTGENINAYITLRNHPLCNCGN
jgi:hypothetical protein